MTATRFVLVRHGETEWNCEDRIQGQLDSPLSAEGVRQCEALAERLRAERFDALVSSDLGRARSSAEIIVRRTGHAVEVDARLRERHYGIFQGLTRSEAKATWPDEYARHEAEGLGDAIPGGESAGVCLARNLACLEELAARHAGGSVLVVAHGGVLDGLHRHVARRAHDASSVFAVPSASVARFSCDGGRWRLDG